jgi:hypothetical protein
MAARTDQKWSAALIRRMARPRPLVDDRYRSPPFLRIRIKSRPVAASAKEDKLIERSHTSPARQRGQMPPGGARAVNPATGPCRFP